MLIPKLVCDVLDHYEIALSQMILNAWRILLVLECLSLRHRVECEIGEVLFTYYLKEYDIDKGRYQLITRVVQVPIITCLRSNDRNWKEIYFFVNGELMYGQYGAEDVPCHWKDTSKNVLCLSSLFLTDTNLFVCAYHDFNQAVPSGLVAEERTR